MENQPFNPIPLFSTTIEGCTLRPHSGNISYYSPSTEKVASSKPPKKPTLKTSKYRITKSHSHCSKSRQVSKISSNIQFMLPKLPYFSPLAHARPLHISSNRLPRSVLCQDVIGPRHIFDLFFPEHIFYLLEQNTNLYTAKKRREDPEKEKEMLGGQPWKPVTVGELKF